MALHFLWNIMQQDTSQWCRSSIHQKEFPAPEQAGQLLHVTRNFSPSKFQTVQLSQNFITLNKLKSQTATETTTGFKIFETRVTETPLEIQCYPLTAFMVLLPAWGYRIRQKVSICNSYDMFRWLPINGYDMYKREAEINFHLAKILQMVSPLKWGHHKWPPILLMLVHLYSLGGIAMPYPFESSSPPTCVSSQFRSITYSMEVDSMRKA